MSFAEQLAGARAFLAAVRRGEAPAVPLSAPEVDQVAAATDHAHRLSRRVADLIRSLEPGRRWTSTTNAGQSLPDAYLAETTARIIVALADCTTVCPHLRRGGPQPAWAFLALHRIDCSRCRHTYRRPPAGEDDRCDWCGARGVSEFTPIAFQRGPLLIFGDACADCAEPLKEPTDPPPTEGAAMSPKTSTRKIRRQGEKRMGQPQPNTPVTPPTDPPKRGRAA